MNLGELPAEVLHRISEYIPAKDAWSNLRPVSKNTDLKLSAVSYWTNQIQTRYKIDLPPRLLPSTAVAAAKRCSSIETSLRRWQWTQGGDEQATKLRDNETYDATTQYIVESQQRGMRFIEDPRGVGMVKLHRTAAGKRFCFTSTELPDHGASIVMWSCEQPVNTAGPVCKVKNAHDVSPKSLATWGDDTIYSASWDNLKRWKIVEGDIQLIDELHMHGVQGLRCVPNGEHEVYCAISEPFEDPYEKGVALFDTRAGLQSAITDPFGSEVINGLATQPDSNYIYAMDWVGRLVMMDKRTLQAVKSMQLPHEAPENLTLSDGTLAVGQLVVGDWHAENECAVLINPVDLNIDKEIRQFPEPTEPWEYDNNVHAKVTEGAIVVSCRDTLNIYTPGTDPKLLHSIKVDSPIAEMDCLGGDIAVGILDGTVAIWSTGKKGML